MTNTSCKGNLSKEKYDLEQEKAFDYTGLDMLRVVRHITAFVSGLWQIHPFREGNTRTTAIFTIQYLRFLSFRADNNLFTQHAWYFRNALVRANYQHIQKGSGRSRKIWSVSSAIC